MNIKICTCIGIALMATTAHAGSMISLLQSKPLRDPSELAKKVDFIKRHGLTHYVVTQIGIKHKLPESVVDQIVFYVKYIPDSKKTLWLQQGFGPGHFDSYSYDFHDLYDIYCKKSNSSIFIEDPQLIFFGECRCEIDPECACESRLNGIGDHDLFEYKQWVSLEYLPRYVDNPVAEQPNILQQLNDAIDAQTVQNDDHEVALKRIFKSHEVHCMHSTLNPDGTELATQLSDGVIKIWDLRNNACIQTFAASPQLKCMFANGGKEFIYSPNGRYWRLIKWNLLKKFERHDYKIEEAIALEKFLDGQKLTEPEILLIERIF